MGEAVRVRIHCDEADRAGHQPLARAIVGLLWREHAAGVTVLRGVEGFGAGRRLHQGRVIDLGMTAPLVVEWIDTAERVAAVWPKLAPLLGHALVTREPVETLVGPHHEVRRLPELHVVDVMATALVTVAPATPVGEVAASMHWHDLRFLPVVEDGAVVGVVTNGDLVERGGLQLRVELGRALGGEPLADPALTAADVMTREVVDLGPRATLLEAARTMTEHHLKRLPVVDAGRLVGILSRVDLLRTVADAAPDAARREVPGGAATVGEVAVREVPRVLRSTPAGDVLDAVVSTRLNRAVVVEDDGRVAGLVSDEEVLRRVGGGDATVVDRLMRRGAAAVAHAHTAEQLMVAPVQTVERGLGLADAVRLMVRSRAKLLPVVDESGRLWGMLDRADALRAIFGAEAAG